MKGEHEVLSESNTKVPDLPSSLEDFEPKYCILRGDHFPDYRVYIKIVVFANVKAFECKRRLWKTSWTMGCKNSQ